MAQLSDSTKKFLLAAYWKNARVFLPENLKAFELFVDWLHPELKYEGRENFPISYRYYSHEINRLAFILNTAPDHIINYVKTLSYDPIANRLKNTEAVLFKFVDIASLPA